MTSASVITRAPRLIEGLVRLLQERDVVPGRDLSLAGLCTDDTALSFTRPVTNVSPQPGRLSMAAMRLLFERLEGTEEPAQVVLVQPEPLTRRATTTVFSHESD